MIKKVLSVTLLLNIFIFQPGFVFAQIIEDDVALQSFKGQRLEKPVCQKQIIEDDTAIDLKNKNFTKPVFLKQIRNDVGAIELNKKTQIRPQFKLVLQEDKFMDEQLAGKKYEKHVVHYKMIDENAEIVKIPVCSSRAINAKRETLRLNQHLDFKVAEDVYRGGEIFIKKNTPVNAVVEIVSKSDKFGDPQELELGHLWTKDLKGNIVELEGTIRKEGANRGKWAKPLYYAGGFVPIFGAPLLLCYFVKGGKVKLSPKEKFDFYYE